MLSEDVHNTFYQELLLGLPASTAFQRARFTEHIIEGQIPIDNLLGLATEAKPIASRFLWLLGDLAETAPQLLYAALHGLFQIKASINGIDVNRSFAKYWQLCGIPVEHEAEAIGMLFNWLNEPKSNVSLKMHAAQALFNVSRTYSELCIELKASLEEQLHKNGKSFDTRAGNLLRIL